eukprot:SAG22_NODE_14664_length_368_cov_1.144981_1_plen_55_part_10
MALQLLGLLAATAQEAAAFDPRAEQNPGQHQAAPVAAAADAGVPGRIFRPQTFGA